MMRPRAAPIRFFFDYISSNAYIAWTQIGRLAELHQREIEPVPVLFAGLLNAQGQLGPAEIPAKAFWTLKNTLRKAHLLGIPLLPPRSHPFNPLFALRLSSLPMAHPVRRALVSKLFEATWAGGPDVTDPVQLAAIAASVGLDGSSSVAAAQTPDAKERLQRQTDEAIASGVFGVPTMIVDGELFWGYDDFPYLERFLRGEGALDPAALAPWAEVRPSARRPRP
jgi:2-hydroxychromene-2-carboxylate isomerase